MPPADRNNPQRAASSDSQYSLIEFMRDFPDDAACLNWLWQTRYSEDGEHAHCPKCETERAFKRYQTSQQRQSWTCTACGHHIHPTAGTIFHKSSTSLQLWFCAIYLMTSTRCGISAKQLERELGVTYKTAWRMMHLIRNELMDDEPDMFDGEVEADETFVGGKRKHAKGRKPAPATPVFGMVQRGGKVWAQPVRDVSAFSLQPIIMKKVMPESTIFTDGHGGYQYIDTRGGYVHERINHSEGVYVSGNVHTQTIENFWSLVRRGISGVYHNVSAKHLQGYLSEYVFRYNHREDGAAMFLTLLLRSARP